MTRRSLPLRSAAVAAAVLAVAVFAGPAANAAGTDSKFDPSKLATPPMRPIQKVTPERFVLRNGVVVYLLENHELPAVSGTAFLRSTPSWTPDDKVGLGSITGTVLRSGGTAAHSGDWLDDRLAAIGASIQSNVSVDLANASFNCLAENAPEVVGLWAEMMQSPAFPDDKIELAKVDLRRQIASRNDEMIPILIRTASQAVYGKSSPWSREPEYATVEAVGRADCAELHRKLFEPSRMVVAVYGDFATAEMKKLLEARLGGWKGAQVALPPLPPLPTENKARLVFAPKEDVTQSGIVLTHIGFRADDADYPAMDVYQTALGGGFQSRLVNEIRTKRGLAYATGANAGEGYQRPGVFIAYTLTRSDSTMTGLDLVRGEVAKSVQAPFTPQELATAKSSVENTFVFNFERPSSVLFRSAFFEVIGYPQDFLQTYQAGLQKVDAAAVQEAAKRKVHPGNLIAVIVGKEKDFEKPLQSAGLPVERVDISIPPPPSKAPTVAATPQGQATAREWLRKSADLAGGSAAWREIKSVRAEQSATLTIQGQSIAMTASLSWALPDRMLNVQRLPFGEMKQGCDGKQGWVSMAGQVKDEPKVAESIKEEWERSFFRLFGSPDDVDIQAADKPATIDGVSYRVAVVKSSLVRDWTLYFAPDGRLARMEFQGEGPGGGPAKQTEIYADWKQVGKVQYPHAQKVLLDGAPFSVVTVTAVQVGAAIDESTFKKPGS